MAERDEQADELIEATQTIADQLDRLNETIEACTSDLVKSIDYLASVVRDAGVR